MKISVVSTLYHSAAYIDSFVTRVAEAATSICGKDDFEIILVNDGSPDNSLEVSLGLTKKYRWLRVVDLSRNFGHHMAMMTGLKYATGELVFLIDSDLEEEPEWLKIFYSHMLKTQADVIFGVQEKRKGSAFEQFSGALFYRIFNYITNVKLPENFVTARLMRKEYVDSLLLHEEREVFIAGLWKITGFNQLAYPVTKHHTSQTTYSFSKKISLFVNSITSFSNAPLVAIFYMGLFIFMIAFIYTTFLVINWLFLSRPLTGWTSLMASVWLLGGLIISNIGVVGIYLSKVFSEVKGRPYTIVKKVYNENVK